MNTPRFHFTSHAAVVVILVASRVSVWSQDSVSDDAAFVLKKARIDAINAKLDVVKAELDLEKAATANAKVQIQAKLFAAENFAFQKNPPVVHNVANQNTVHHIDHVVYGTTVIYGQQQIENQLGNKVQQLSSEYDLTEAQQSKLMLAAQCEAKQFSNEVDALRQKYNSTTGDIIGQQIVVKQAQALQKKRQTLFGPDSFSSKVMARTVTGEQLSKYQAALEDRLRIRHRSNIEGAIRDIERQVVIKIAQHEALVELLISEIPPPKSTHDYDETMVKYQLSRIFEQKLRPVFEEDQWPQVRQILDGFHELEAALVQQGLIDQEGAEASKPANTPQVNKVPTDATPIKPNRAPQNGKEP